MDSKITILALVAVAFMFAGCAFFQPSEQPGNNSQPALPPGQKAYLLPNGSVQIIDVAAIQQAADSNTTKLLLSAQGKISAGDYDAAIVFCDEALKSNSSMVSAYVYRAEAKYRKGLENESKADLDSARALEKTVPSFEKFKSAWGNAG